MLVLAMFSKEKVETVDVKKQTLRNKRTKDLRRVRIERIFLFK